MPIDPNNLPKPSPGRRSKLMDQALVDELIELIQYGNYVPTACQAVGIAPQTFYRWMQTATEVDDWLEDAANREDLEEAMWGGEIPVGIAPLQVRAWVFRERAQKASAVSEANAVMAIRKQMPTQWAAAMTFLERRFPGRWKRKEQIDIGETDAASGIDESLMLGDPVAVKLMHQALQRAAKGQLPPPEEIIPEATVVEESDVVPPTE